MHFKDFVTRQRALIFVVGLLAFGTSLLFSAILGHTSMLGILLLDLAGSALTIIFTAFIIDYLSLREESDRTQAAAGLAEDEIKATCFRIKWRLARLFGLGPREEVADKISTRQEAGDYLQKVTTEVDEYLDSLSFVSDSTPIHEHSFVKYLERLQLAQTELEQTLMLYEYAMSYSLRERVLALRSELQIADHLLTFIDIQEPINAANRSLMRITAQSIYNAVETVLEHDSRIETGVPLSAKDSRI